ncbi:ryncolin-1-like [Ciona intestinalis]
MKVFQRRTDGSQDFYLGWDKYLEGFGNKNNEFWLGLEKLHLLTRNGRYELRVDLKNCTNFAKYAVYSDFRVGSSPYYQLTSTGYSGNAATTAPIPIGSSRDTPAGCGPMVCMVAYLYKPTTQTENTNAKFYTIGDALRYHNGHKFTTKDQDNDIHERTNCPRHGCDNCAVKHNGAWWYSKCHHANLNGLYDPCVVQVPFHGIVSWDTFNNEKRGLRFSEMKFRPIN